MNVKTFDSYCHMTSYYCDMFTSAKEVMFLPVFVCLSLLAR